MCVCVVQLELSNEEVIKKELLGLTQGYFQESSKKK